MTSIEFGGGPSLEQRREFLRVKHGSQKPGYTGYCPQVKYNIGRTFGDQTHICAEDFPHVFSDPDARSHERPPIRNEIPDVVGVNKYLKDMKPGYSGYIPRLKFKFGGTYATDCELSIDEHLTNHKNKMMKNKQLHDTLVSFPRLQALNFDPEIKNHLNTYRDCQCLSPVLYESKRPLLEPVMYGYTGFIPRLSSTEAGLGVRYHQMNVNGLKMFQHENSTHFDILQMPVCITQGSSSKFVEEKPAQYRRVYKKDGMIPKYTGHVPYFDMDFGKTFGDSTRQLEECKHDKESYGDFMLTKPLPPAQIVF